MTLFRGQRKHKIHWHLLKSALSAVKYSTNVMFSVCLSESGPGNISHFKGKMYKEVIKTFWLKVFDQLEDFVQGWQGKLIHWQPFCKWCSGANDAPRCTNPLCQQQLLSSANLACHFLMQSASKLHQECATWHLSVLMLGASSL